MQDVERILLFDVDGVLIDGYHARPEYRRCWDETIEADLGIDRLRFQAEFMEGVFMSDVLTGRIDLQCTLEEYLPRLGYTGTAGSFMRYWFEKDSHLNLDLMAHVARLKESGRARLFIATNQEHGRAEYLMGKLGLCQYFEDIFYSARIGHKKPTLEYFEAVREALPKSPIHPPILFDDTPAVVTAAQEFGWEAVEFLTVENLLESPAVVEILDSCVLKD